MPCYDHRDSSDYKLTEMKERCDMLARIACKAMTLIEELGKEDFLLLKDKETRDWWAEHKILDAEYMAAQKEKEEVVYKDMRGEPCEICGEGTYTETSIHDDWDGVLHCDYCEHATPSRIEI